MVTIVKNTVLHTWRLEKSRILNVLSTKKEMVNMWHDGSGDHFTIYVYQINTLYTNLPNDTCQLYLNKAGKNKD